MTVTELIGKLQNAERLWTMYYKDARSEADDIDTALCEGRMLAFGEVLDWIYDEGLEI